MQVDIKIIKPGIFTSIQDLGRNGYRSAGIGPGGAMDFFASSIANILVGNKPGHPVIEFHYPAAEIEFGAETLVSLTGGDFGAFINDRPVALWKVQVVKKGGKLSFKQYKSGARTYLAARGIIQANNWLNSYSTDVKARAGGHEGRALATGDILSVEAAYIPAVNRLHPGLNNMVNSLYYAGETIRCIAGNEWPLLDDASKAVFQLSSFTVSSLSDRTGYRMSGPNLALQNPEQLISSPVDAGTMQLLPNGQLLVLMADHPTTGGYPRIANAISADLPALAQRAAHSRLRFEMVTIETAEAALVALHQVLQEMQDHNSI